MSRRSSGSQAQPDGRMHGGKAAREAPRGEALFLNPSGRPDSLRVTFTSKSFASYMPPSQASACNFCHAVIHYHFAIHVLQCIILLQALLQNHSAEHHRPLQAMRLASWFACRPVNTAAQRLRSRANASASVSPARTPTTGVKGKPLINSLKIDNNFGEFNPFKGVKVSHMASFPMASENFEIIVSMC